MADPQAKMTAGEFAARVRAKYPGAYDAVSDGEIRDKILAKYPQYGDSVEPTPGFFGRLFSNDYGAPKNPLHRDLSAIHGPMPGMTEGANLAESLADWTAGGPGEVIGSTADLAQGNIARGAHRAISGAGTTMLPALPFTAVAAPLLTARMLAGGYVGSKLAGEGAKAAGATEDQADLAGDIGGLVGGGLSAKAPKIATKAGQVLTKAASVANPDLIGVVSPRAANAIRVAKRVGTALSPGEPEAPAVRAARASTQPHLEAFGSKRTIAGTAQEATDSVTGPGKYAHKEVDELTTPVRRPVNEVQPQEDIPAVKTHEPPVPNAQPASMEGFYGKTKQKSNLKANQRQLASPTASTAPGQPVAKAPAPESGLPRSIMDIMTKPGLSDADLKILQDFNAHLKPAAPGMAGMKNYSTIGQIAGKAAPTSAKASQGAAAPLPPLLQRGFEAIRESDARVAAQPNTYVRSLAQRPGYGTAAVPVEERVPQQSLKIKVRRKQAGR